MKKPFQIPCVAPCLVEQLEQYYLAEAAGVLHCCLDVPDATLNDLFGRCNPAGTRARRDNLGERIHAHYAPIYIHAEK